MLSVLAFAGGFAAAGSLALVACGGEPKTPLMPDSIDQPTLDAPEAGAPAAPGTGTSPPPSTKSISK